MNPVEIEQAISDLAEAPFDAAEFPYAFLEAFGRKETEIKKLRKGDSNKSDLNGVLQRNNIHIATCAPGAVSQTFAALKASPATAMGLNTYSISGQGRAQASLLTVTLPPADETSLALMGETASLGLDYTRAGRPAQGPERCVDSAPVNGWYFRVTEGG